MTELKRHRTPTRSLEADFQYNSRSLPRFIEGARKNPISLDILARTALNVASLAAVTQPESSIFRDALVTSAEAFTAIFALSDPDNPTREFTIDGKSSVAHQEIPKSNVEPGYWMIGYFLAALCRRRDLLNTLCHVDTALLRRSPTRHPEYRYLWIDALKSHWSRDKSCTDTLVAAIEATAPDRKDILDLEYVWDLDFPATRLNFYLAAEDAEFGEPLIVAIERHKRYWAKTTERRREWHGFFSVPLASMTAMAVDAGISAKNIVSDYCPTCLYEGRFLNPG